MDLLPVLRIDTQCFAALEALHIMPTTDITNKDKDNDIVNPITLSTRITLSNISDNVISQLHVHQSEWTVPSETHQKQLKKVLRDVVKHVKRRHSQLRLRFLVIRFS